jgi:hypothetical protein
MNGQYVTTILNSFGQYLCPAIGDRSHHQTLAEIKFKVLPFYIVIFAFMDWSSSYILYILYYILCVYTLLSLSRLSSTYARSTLPCGMKLAYEQFGIQRQPGTY